MRNLFSILTASLFAVLFIVACSKSGNESTDEISKEVLEKIADLGFSTTDVTATDGGFIVEGDIFLSHKNLSESPTSPNLVIASEEQYHTFNLVTGLPRTITVSLNTNAQYFVDATNEAISRFNQQNLRLNFQVVNGDADIDIVTFYQVSNTIGSGGFQW
jgi:Dual-action HEIGH metallo-peptidase